MRNRLWTTKWLHILQLVMSLIWLIRGSEQRKANVLFWSPFFISLILILFLFFFGGFLFFMRALRSGGWCWSFIPCHSPQTTRPRSIVDAAVLWFARLHGLSPREVCHILFYLYFKFRSMISCIYNEKLILSFNSTLALCCSFLCHQNFDVAIRDSLSAFVAVGIKSDGSILFAKANLVPLVNLMKEKPMQPFLLLTLPLNSISPVVSDTLGLLSSLSSLIAFKNHRRAIFLHLQAFIFLLRSKSAQLQLKKKTIYGCPFLGPCAKKLLDWVSVHFNFYLVFLLCCTG